MLLRPYRKNTDTPGIVVEGMPVPGASVSVSYRTNRSVGYRYLVSSYRNLPKYRVPVYDFVPNHTGVFGMVLRTYRTNTRTPGIADEGIPVPRVPVSNSYKTY